MLRTDGDVGLVVIVRDEYRPADAAMAYGSTQRITTRRHPIAAMSADRKPAVDAARIASLRLDAEDLLRHVDDIVATDPSTAELLLSNKVFALTGLAFDLRGWWVPPPNQRLARLDALDPELAIAVRRYCASRSLAHRLELAKSIVDQVFAAEPAIADY